MIKNKLNIAIFHLAFIYSGGGEKLVFQEYDGLKKLGHNVSIFTTVINRKKSFPDVIKKYNIKTFLPDWKFFKGHEAFQTVLSCILVPFYAYKFKNFDVILACNQPSPWMAYVINKLYGIPYVSYLAQPTRFLHPRKIDKATGLFFAKKASESISARLMMSRFKKFSDWADKISIRSSNQVMVNGGYIQKLIDKIYKVKSINCPSGVNITKIKNPKKSNYLLVTNRHFAQKRIEYAIFTLNSIKQNNPNYRLKIAGSNTEYTLSLKDLAVELGIDKSIDFLDYVNEKDLRKLYEKAKCYLYTAPEEDFGMGIIEAMSFGTPVVAWNATGPGKIITNDIDGFLAKPYDINDFIRLVQEVINNKKLAKNIQKNSIEKVKKHFSLKKHIVTIDNALKSVVSLNNAKEVI